MNKIRKALLATILLASLVDAAPAQVVIFDNFPPGDTYNALVSVSPERNAAVEVNYAVQFVTPAGPPLAVTEIHLGIFRADGLDAAFRMTLTHDVDGTPGGAPLASIDVDNLDIPEEISFDMLLPHLVIPVTSAPALEPETAYWIVIEPGFPSDRERFPRWSLDGTNLPHEFARRVPPGAWAAELRCCALFRVSGTSANEAPVALDDAYTTPEDTPLAVAAPGVLANDTDAEGDELSAALETGPANGTFLLAGVGAFGYVPDAGFFGTDSFAYTATDGFATSGPAIVTIEVTAVNDRPIAADDAYTMSEDTQLAVGPRGVLGNDSDEEGSALEAMLETRPTNGAVILNADGSFDYTPNADFSGTDSFTYAASDGENASAPATVTIEVSAINDPPLNTVPETQFVILGLGQVVFSNNDAISISDVDGSAVQVMLVATNGRLTLDGTAGLGFFEGDGTNDISMTFVGAIPAINAALDGLRYDPTLTRFLLSGRGSVRITTNDLGNTGVGGPLSDTDTVDIRRLLP